MLQQYESGDPVRSCNPITTLFFSLHMSVRTQVKELYQGVLGRLQILCPRMTAEERVGEGYERMKKEMEREVVRRKSLASQLRTVLDSQLQVYITLHIV